MSYTVCLHCAAWQKTATGERLSTATSTRKSQTEIQQIKLLTDMYSFTVHDGKKDHSSVNNRILSAIRNKNVLWKQGNRRQQVLLSAFILHAAGHQPVAAPLRVIIAICIRSNRVAAPWWICWKFWLLASVRRPRRRCQHQAPYGPLWENMTSSTEEAHNIFYCCQRRTEPWPQVTYRKFSEAWTCGFWDIPLETDTDIQTHCNTLHPYHQCSN